MKVKALFSCVLLFFAARTASASPWPSGRKIYVKAGRKIQDAINKAPVGSEIIVAPGTYKENLLITKDGIRLRGQQGAILSPPAAFERDNICSDNVGDGTQAAICIAGAGIEVDDFIAEHKKVISVKRPVKDVSISGLRVQPQTGFNGANILILGAERTRIESNELIDGPAYGVLASGSTNTFLDGNTITLSDPANSPGIIGMCMDNFSGAYGSNNAVTFYVIGLCIQTDGAELRNNDVSYNCRAAYADPYVRGIQLIDNHLHNSYNACGAFGSYGVTLTGTTDALVKGNLIEEIHNDGPAAGVLLTDDPCTDGSLACSDNRGVLVVAKGNKVVGNTLRNNDLDIEKRSSGRGNVVVRNRCASSEPDGLC